MILVVGDYIEDFYTFGRAARICPEGPVPVIVPEHQYSSAGGVGLVSAQLRELGAVVCEWRGSLSQKTRIFVNSHLVCRLDEDSMPFEPAPFPDKELRECDAVIVSDYGKGAIFEEILEEIQRANKQVFADAKHSWQFYDMPNAYWFPNNEEIGRAWLAKRKASFGYNIQLIHKRGARGCKWGDEEIPAAVSEVVDTTGAGDIFLAAFVHGQMNERLIPSDCLRFANEVAGESCRHRGTYVVPKAFALSVLDKLRFSQASAQQRNGQDYYSIEGELAEFFRQNPAQLQSFSRGLNNPDVDYIEVRGAKDECSPDHVLARIRRKSPSSPTGSHAAPIAERIDLEPSSKKPWEG